MNEALAEDNGFTLGLDIPQVNARWSLTAAAVPDAGLTVVLIGMGLVGMLLFRRRLTPI